MSYKAIQKLIGERKISQAIEMLNNSSPQTKRDMRIKALHIMQNDPKRRVYDVLRYKDKNGKDRKERIECVILPCDVGGEVLWQVGKKRSYIVGTNVRLELKEKEYTVGEEKLKILYVHKIFPHEKSNYVPAEKKEDWKQGDWMEELANKKVKK